MKIKIVCPNATCESHTKKSRSRLYSKNGYYHPRHSTRPIPRYKCKVCGRIFSSRTDVLTTGDKKPGIDKLIFNLLCSGMTKRRIARVLQVTPATVEEKISRMAERARPLQAEFLGRNLRSRGFFQYDELQTYLWTKLKPLSVAIAVEPETRILVAMQVAQMPCGGRLRTASERMFGELPDNRPQAREKVFAAIKTMALSGDVHTDGDRSMLRFFQRDGFMHIQHVRNYNKHSNDDSSPEITLKQDSNPAKREINPLWIVDHMCARLRADIGCLARRTWVITKSIAGLQDALDVYIAYHNRLPLFDRCRGTQALGPRPPHPGRIRVTSAAKRRAMWLEEHAQIRDDKGNVEFEDWDYD